MFRLNLQNELIVLMIHTAATPANARERTNYFARHAMGTLDDPFPFAQCLHSSTKTCILKTKKHQPRSLYLNISSCSNNV